MFNNQTLLFKFFFIYFLILIIVIILIINSEISINKIRKIDIKCKPIRYDSNHNYFKIGNEIYPKSFQLHKNKSIDFDCLNQNKKTKLILFWNKFYGKLDHNYGVGKKIPLAVHKCPVTNCELTNDRSRLNEADFVIVSITDLKEKRSQLPRKRPFKQRWIFFMFESPQYKPDYSEFNSFFNLTSTYTIDSNFPGGNL